MKIGFDAKRAFNNTTGLGNYSRFVINALLELYPQHEYYLYTPRTSGPFEHFYKAGPNVHIVTPQSFLERKFASAWRSLSLTDEIIENGLDVFHGLSNELPVGIQRFKGKKIVTLHDLIFLRYPDYYVNIDRYIYTKKFRHACEEADTVIAVSEQTKTDLVSYFKTEKEKIHVVYQNCDISFNEPASPGLMQEVHDHYKLPANYILCVGTIEQRKNQLAIVEAFHALNDKSLRLVVVGKQTEYSNKLHQYIAESRLTDQVMFLGHVKFAHLPAIYQGADLCVYASEFEGFGIPIMEAMRSRVPVIAADNSSLTEVGGKAVVYFQYDDARELSQKIRLVLSSPEMRNEMIAEGIRQAAKFDTVNVIGQLMDCYGKS